MPRLTHTVFTLKIWTDSPEQTVHQEQMPHYMPHNAASDQGLHCLPIIHQFLDMLQVVKWSFQNHRVRFVQKLRIPMVTYWRY